MPKVAYRDDRNDDGRNKRDSDEVEIGRLSVEQFHRILQLARHYAAENKGQSKENQRLLRENEYLKGWLTSYDLAVQRARLQDVLKQIYEKKQMEVSCFMDLVIWWNTVLDSDELLAVCFSGLFDLRTGCIKLDSGEEVPVSPGFDTEVLVHGNMGAGKSNFMVSLLSKAAQDAVKKAAELGNSIVTNLEAEDYLEILQAQRNAFVGDGGDPIDPLFPSNFISAVSVLINYLHISRNEFSERSMLDVKTYDRIKRLESWHPKEETCKAILFALRPNIVSAFRLYELAGYSFKNCDEDKLMLAMFGVGDYDIDKYNEVMESRKGKTLGSRSRK